MFPTTKWKLLSIFSWISILIYPIYGCVTESITSVNLKIHKSH